MTPTPSSAPPGSDVPPAPPSRRAPAVLRPFLAVLGLVRRRPGRCAAVLLLLALTALGLGVAGAQLWAAYHFRAARAALDHYHYQEAGAHLEACMAVWPEDPDVLFLAGQAARRSGLFEEAEGLLDRCKELLGRDDRLTLERALLTAQRGDVDEVGKFLHARAEAGGPDAPLIWEALVRGCLRSFKQDEAEGAARAWQQSDPSNPMAELLLGRVARDRQSDLDAARHFRRALEIDPELDEARDQLAAILVETHQAPEALPHLEYLARRRPGDPAVAIRLAQCRDLMGQQDEAVRLLDGVLDRYPQHPAALAERGKLALRAGQWAEAEAWLRRALAFAPGDATLLPQLRQCLMQAGKTDEALALDAQIKQANDEAERLDVLIKKEIQAHPQDANLQYEAGTILLRAGAITEGLRWLNSAVRLDPRHAKAHEALADFYQRIGDGAKAAKHRRLARQAAEGQ